MKKTIVFLACLMLAAPFVVAEENESPPGEAGTFLLAQDQDRVQDQLHDQTQDLTQDQLRTQDRDQLQTPDKDQLRTQDRDQLHDRTQEQVDKDDPAYLQAMHQHQFRHENTQRIQNMIQEAQKKGLPTEPMQNKVHEGIAKRAPEEAIVQAVERVQRKVNPILIRVELF